MAVVVGDDIISYGSEREPRWRTPRWQPPRWWRMAAAAAGVAVVVAVAFLWYLPGPGRHGAPPGPGAASPSPAAHGEPPLPLPASAPPPLPTTPARMTGRPLPRDAGLRVLLGGQRPAWLSVGTGQTEPIRGLPQHANGYQLDRIAGGWVAQPFPGGNGGCGNCATRPLPAYYVADGSRAAARIGAASFTAPAATAGALWLASYPRGADMSAAAGDAQEVSTTGARLGPPVRLPAGYVIDLGTRAGLLLVQEQAGSGAVRYELWDPATRRVTRTFENVIAASPAEIAWTPVCTAADCRVHVLGLAGGRAGEIALPGRAEAGDGAFSPDGRFLALGVAAGVTADGRPAVNRLLVATLATGQVTTVPGSTVGSGNGVDFGWQTRSHLLIADVGLGGGQPGWQIAVWRPGVAWLSVVLARAPDGSWPVLDQGPY